MQKEIFFKAGENPARSYGAYREIIKRGEGDNASCNDDVLQIVVSGKTIFDIKIDCDLETGEFRMFWNEEDNSGFNI